MKKTMADNVRAAATVAVDQLKRISSVVSMQEADNMVKQAVVSLAQGFGTGPARLLGVVPVQEVVKTSWRLGSSSDIFRRAGALQICLDLDLPITLADIDLIRGDLTFRRVEGSIYSYIVVNNEAARSLVSRLGIYAIVNHNEWGNPNPYKMPSYFLRRHGRMSATESGAAPEKSKQDKITEARTATILYYAGMARLAQKNYMRVFNAAVEAKADSCSGNTGCCS